MSTEESTCQLEDAISEEDEWSCFSQWIHCICVVTFDLNLGQALEFVYPPEFTPSEQEISNICYLAFPDSNSGCMGDTKFHMRFRISPNLNKRESALHRFANYNKDCLPTLRADNSHYWGFVYFRQRRDANLPRGYFQKSFIILTRLPFFNLYYDLLSQLAPKYFDEGTFVLEQFCKQITEMWPQLQAGSTLFLPLLDINYKTIIPKATSRKILSTAESSTSSYNSNILKVPTKIITSVNELELFRNFEFIIENIYTLWELVLIGEPIVVVGTSPADCSYMVQCLVSIISPLEYCAEARPYFTIHDSEFKEFTRESKSPPSIILGVTNPFFIKLLKDWPHMLRLVDKQINIQQQKQLMQKNMQNNLRGEDKSNSSKSNVNSTNMTVSSTVGITSCDGSSPGLHTKYKSFLKKDKNLIKKILHGIKLKRPEQVQTALLRRHLLELTQSFIIPLERYMASLMPLQKDISPFKSTPNTNAFKLDDFLSKLELSGPQLTSPVKGDWKGLYKRFFNSPNFRGWYETRNRELQITLQELQLQALSEVNLEHWARDKQEVEIIDMILKLKQKLNLYTENFLLDKEGSNNAKTSETQKQIQAQINFIKELLPPDLRNVVNI